MESKEMITIKEKFAKDITHLSFENCKKLIPIMENKSATKLIKQTKRSGAYVVIDQNSNFVLCFFYHANGLKGMQYLIDKNIIDPLLLCGLYSEQIINYMNKLKVIHSHNVIELADFYCKQITGYKEFLKQKKQ